MKKRSDKTWIWQIKVWTTVVHMYLGQSVADVRKLSVRLHPRLSWQDLLVYFNIGHWFNAKYVRTIDIQARIVPACAGCVW